MKRTSSTSASSTSPVPTGRPCPTRAVVRVPRLASAAAGLAALAAPAWPQDPGASGVTERVSLTSAGLEAVEDSSDPALSSDGRFVSFESEAALVPEDTNGFVDVYLLDRETGVLVPASVGPAGNWGNEASYESRVTPDGRHVLFHTQATDLLPGSPGEGLFVKDTWTGALTRIDRAWGTNQASSGSAYFSSISDDGTRVAFRSSGDDLVPVPTAAGQNVFLYDLATGTMHVLSNAPGGPANGVASYPELSADGQRVVFESNASNLVPGDVNGKADVFLAELGQPLRLLSRNLAGVPGNGHSTNPTISADGSRVAFLSAATDLLAVDGNGIYKDAFVVEVDTGALELASISTYGLQAFTHVKLPVITRDGRSVAFESDVEYAPYGSASSDVFLRDLDAGATCTIARPDGVALQADASSWDVALSEDGSIVAFHSFATNMVPGDTNGRTDVFVRTRHPDPFEYCTSVPTSAGCQPRAIPYGFPSAGSQSKFRVQGVDLPNARWGMLIYSFGGATSKPFGGGTLCIRGAKHRTPVQHSGGSPGGIDDCTGTYDFDPNAFAAGLLGGSPKARLSQVGEGVNVQYWGRDPQGGGSFFTTAVEYVVGP